MNNLFNNDSNESYTDLASEIDAKAHFAISAIFAQYPKVPRRQLAYLLQLATFEVMCEELLGWGDGKETPKTP